MFENAVNASKNCLKEENTNAVHETTMKASNCNLDDLQETQMENDNHDMFHNINHSDDSDIIPETQYFHDESNDSGESVIPLPTNKGNDQFKVSSDDSDDSEFGPVRPESSASDHIEQSQMLMANIDRSLFLGAHENVEALSTTENAVHNAANDNDCVNRKESITPDLENISPMAENSKAGPQSVQNANDMDETQMFIDDDPFLAATQLPTTVFSSTICENNDDDIDVFAAAKPPVQDAFEVETQIAPEYNFEQPKTVDSNTVHGKSNQIVDGEVTDDEDEVFCAATQPNPLFAMPAPHNSSHLKPKPSEKIIAEVHVDDIFEAATQRQLDEDVFEISTQIAPEHNFAQPRTVKFSEKSKNSNQNVSAEEIDNDDGIFGADTQQLHESVFAHPGKIKTLHSKSKKITTITENNENDDTFDAATQLAPDEDIFDVATQIVTDKQKKTAGFKPNDESRKENDHNNSGWYLH